MMIPLLLGSISVIQSLGEEEKKLSELPHVLAEKPNETESSEEWEKKCSKQESEDRNDNNKNNEASKSD